ncbi:DEAD/DEAH box helicase [Candidatus Uhrbacteria bacterium]|nr:DEAD/DEAH box helicase [Candidatus Uhrbacteria bacterium]
MSPNKTSGFYGLGIAPKLLEALDKNKFTEPSPIQQQAIPVALQGEDVIGIAQTGTGKTLAFGIPMIQRLAAVKGRGLVILPTRELALQVEESLQKFGREIGLRTACLIGGASMYHQKQALMRKPHIIVATPGRLIDHLEHRGVDLSNVTVLVLDEADRMLDMGFEPQIRRILQAVPKERQTMLFSATMPAAIVDIANRYMKKPTRVEIARAGTLADKVTQEVYFVSRDEKPLLLEQLLTKFLGTVLVFTRTKHGASKLTRKLKSLNHNSAEIHSDRSLSQRRRALDGFKNGEFRVLVATDIAARGIDVKNIELVVNYDLPDQADDYVHRIGRTGRAGSTGHAISFATPDQKMDVKSIERLIRQQIPIKVPKDLPKPTFTPAERFHDDGPKRFDERRVQDHSKKSFGYGGQKSYGQKSYGHKRGGYQNAFTSARREDKARRDSRPGSEPPKDFPTGGRTIRVHS